MKERSTTITRRIALCLAAGAFALRVSPVLADVPAMLVHKDPDCGCCGGWVKHLRAAGFTVTVSETSDLGAVRKRLGVPADLRACHTAEIGGYVVEGHVPAEAVRRLLSQRPPDIGLAVPGMPQGSPGMEGGTPKEYDVMIFGASGAKPFLRFNGTKIVG